MNIFILSTGRCGSTTFARACRHIDNYSSGHESRSGALGPTRLDYPPHHIESDNRLVWFLGRLAERYPDPQQVCYLHLWRDPEAVARSYAQRLRPGMIIPAWLHGIHLGSEQQLPADALMVARDYVTTVNSNIRHFLADRHHLTFELEQAARDWPRFWQRIGARGDYAAALATFTVRHNATPLLP